MSQWCAVVPNFHDMPRQGRGIHCKYCVERFEPSPLHQPKMTRRHMRFAAVALAAAFLSWIGCGKKSADSSTQAATQATVQSGETQSAAPAVQPVQTATAQEPNAEPLDL